MMVTQMDDAVPFSAHAAAKIASSVPLISVAGVGLYEVVALEGVSILESEACVHQLVAFGSAFSSNHAWVGAVPTSTASAGISFGGSPPTSKSAAGALAQKLASGGTGT